MNANNRFMCIGVALVVAGSVAVMEQSFGMTIIAFMSTLCAMIMMTIVTENYD